MSVLLPNLESCSWSNWSVSPEKVLSLLKQMHSICRLTDRVGQFWRALGNRYFTREFTSAFRGFTRVTVQFFVAYCERYYAVFLSEWSSRSSQGKTAVPRGKPQFPGENCSSRGKASQSRKDTGIVPTSHCFWTQALSPATSASPGCGLNWVPYCILKRAFNSVRVIRRGNILRQSVKIKIPSSTATAVVSSVLSISSSAFEIHTKDK